MGCHGFVTIVSMMTNGFVWIDILLFKKLYSHALNKF
jgi:hypothetical protein